MDDWITFVLIGGGLVLIPTLFFKRKARRNYLIFMLLMLVLGFVLLALGKI